MTGRAGIRRLAAVALSLVAGALASGCAATPDSASGLASWASQASFSSTVALLRGDVRDINAGFRLAKLRATHTACDGLGTDAASAIGQLPAPDHRLTTMLNAAYSGLINAAQACSDATALSGRSVAAYKRRSVAALATLSAATARLHALERR
ncbi:MAG: hypothetical protein M0004_04105 [Actinomycetota bacterium]|nr:hypothetical protein [Actinomycetota bacterium]